MKQLCRNASSRLISRRITWLMLLSLFLPIKIQAGTVGAVVTTVQLQELGLPLNGVVKSVSVTPGSTVSAGDVLLQLDCRLYDLQEQLNASHAEAIGVEQKQAKDELDRTLEMYDQDLIAEVELTEAKDRFAQLDARYRSAMAKYSIAKTQAGHCILRSPIDGTVLSVNTNVGATVVGEQNIQPLIGIVTEGVATAMAWVPEPDILLVGQKVIVLVGDMNKTAYINHIEKQDGGQWIRIIFSDPAGLNDKQKIQLNY